MAKAKPQVKTANNNFDHAEAPDTITVNINRPSAMTAKIVL